MPKTKGQDVYIPLYRCRFLVWFHSQLHLPFLHCALQQCCYTKKVWVYSALMTWFHTYTWQFSRAISKAHTLPICGNKELLAKPSLKCNTLKFGTYTSVATGDDGDFSWKVRNVLECKLLATPKHDIVYRNCAIVQGGLRAVLMLLSAIPTCQHWTMICHANFGNSTSSHLFVFYDFSTAQGDHLCHVNRLKTSIRHEFYIIQKDQIKSAANA